ncbi:hypothetical protein GCM10023169_03150 [Georgenia halophila]|uniref:Alpha-L-fucosidase 2 n=1 Tax=Georgenia halophila TaxID=620889 RepID=A0ABP8KTD9_9MICO
MGNGRTGVMCRAGLGRTRLQLNDATGWSGSAASPAAARPELADGEGPEILAAARAALDSGDHRGAEQVLRRLQGQHSQAFLPFADIELSVRPAADGQPAATTARRERTSVPKAAVQTPTIGAIDRSRQAGRGSGPHEQAVAGDPDGAALVRWLDVHAGVAGHVEAVGEHEVRHETWAGYPSGVVVHEIAVRGPGNSTAGTRHAAVDVEVATTSVLRGEARTGPSRLTHRLRLPSDVVPDHEEATEHVVYDEGSRHGLLIVDVLLDHAPAPLEAPTHGGPGARVSVPAGSTLSLILATGTTSPPGGGSGSVADLEAALTDLLTGAAARGTAALRAEHVADHAELMDRCTLTLPPGRDATLPTADRLRAQEAGGSDPELAALVFGFGRHLLISASRPGGPPANLQGIWNENLPAPWSSNYTVNINAEMAYWPAEITGLPECHEPLLDQLARTAAGPGGEAARDLYGAAGWVIHHNSDPWGYALPAAGDAAWASWPMGGVWLSRHVADHLAHLTGAAATETARELWPVVAGAVDFALSWIRPAGPAGTADTAPATSPENHFLHDGEAVAVAPTTRMDVELLTALADTGRRVGRAAGADLTTTERLTELVALLPPAATGPDGELLEWDRYRPEAEPEHRHLSHLAGLYPLGLWDTETRPDLARAAARTLERRGPESTGWSLAWRLGLWARLRDAGRAEEQLLRAMRVAADDGPHRGGLYPNLFSAHPPFQVDGNHGLVAGMAETLLDPRDGVLRLLPAPPPGWRGGEVRGLRAPRGIAVDLVWDDGALSLVRLRGGAGPVTVRTPSAERAVLLAPGRDTVLDGDLAAVGTG